MIWSEISNSYGVETNFDHHNYDLHKNLKFAPLIRGARAMGVAQFIVNFRAHFGNSAQLTNKLFVNSVSKTKR